MMTHISPLTSYFNAIKKDEIKFDALQNKLILLFDDSFKKLINSSWCSKLNYLLTSKQPANSYYIWGTVGRGKTYLINLFLNSLGNYPTKTWHYNHFMQVIHRYLQNTSDKKKSLTELTRQLSKKYKIIFIDELFIIDIADAMLIYGILQGLIKYRVILITSSNFAPCDLYKNGLQRESFLPAIALIEQYMTVCCLNDDANNIDYRKQMLSSAKVYHYPNSPQIQQLLETTFTQLCRFNHSKKNSYITVLKRKINTIMHTEDMVWFSFEELCKSMRATIDYIEITKQYKILFVSNICQMDDKNLDWVRRLISLIDELYFAKIKIFVSAATSIDNLYSGQTLAYEFARTKSRFFEMQSIEYLES